MEYALLFLAANTVGVAVFSYLTNPFNRRHIIKSAYKTNIKPDGNIELIKIGELKVRSKRFFSLLATLKSGYHIMTGALSRAKKAEHPDFTEIISEIHRIRFSGKNHFLISGDHFSALYPRSLGIFYHVLLDKRTALDDKDWTDRQIIYLKTIGYALDVFSKANDISTTVVPVGPLAVTLVNIYAYPSDTLYSLLYALKVITDPSEINRLYPFGSNIPLKNNIGQAGHSLLEKYSKSLKKTYEAYENRVWDKSTGLIKENIRLSGTKDMAIRSCAFYDNVSFWRTMQLAQDLQIIDKDPSRLTSLKNEIIKNFWNNESEIFKEEKNNIKAAYSSDWLIAYQTGFLDPHIASDRKYLTKMIGYIINHKIDQPFGLKYHNDFRGNQLYWPVRIFAQDYGSRVIWSHWGMEYIKLLAQLGYINKDKSLIIRAQKQIESYKNIIIQSKSYPEVYSPDGKPYRQGMYRSVMRTGWVVNFEQAKMMVESLTAGF